MYRTAPFGHTSHNQKSLLMLVRQTRVLGLRTMVLLSTVGIPTFSSLHSLSTQRLPWTALGPRILFSRHPRVAHTLEVRALSYSV